MSAPDSPRGGRTPDTDLSGGTALADDRQATDTDKRTAGQISDADLSALGWMIGHRTSRSDRVWILSGHVVR